MLTDAEGLVLNRLSGDSSLLRALDAVHLAPGFAYSERQAGTNGLGLALADRAPTVVRNEEHYSLSLGAYTCAAVPVVDPVSGRLEGAVNLTTRAQFPGALLLALAQSAAGNTSALMLARSRGRRPRPAPRGQVFRVENEPASGTVRELSRAWTSALADAEQALRAGRVVAAVGESGSGRATLLAQAQRLARPRDRILSASTPAPCRRGGVAVAVVAGARQAPHSGGRPGRRSPAGLGSGAPALARAAGRRRGRRGRTSRRAGCRSRSPPSASRTSPRRSQRSSRPSSPSHRCASDPTTSSCSRGTPPAVLGVVTSTSRRPLSVR